MAKEAIFRSRSEAVGEYFIGMDVYSKSVYKELHVSELSTYDEICDAWRLIVLCRDLLLKPNSHGGAIDTLVAAFRTGPLDTGDLPSKSGRTILVKNDLMTMVVVKGQDGFYALNMRGYYIYKLYQFAKVNNNDFSKVHTGWMAPFFNVLATPEGLLMITEKNKG